MNIHKHMEAIFLVVLAVIGVGSYLLDELPEAQAKLPLAVVAHNIATPGTMAVVIVKAQRARRGA
jgi:uncharacterized integral membrane protein